MAPALRLLHLANSHSTNVGNGALILGTEATVAEDFAAPIEWLREPWDDYTFELRQFDRAFVDRVNACDGMVVGGAVAIHGRHYLRNTGMRFDLPLDLWAELRSPVAFYGLSYRHWRYQPFHHLDKLKRALEIILTSPNMLFSVRNDGTAAWLERLTGMPPGRLQSVPDPGLYVPHDDGKYDELRSDRRNIIIAFNNEDAVYRYGGWRRELLSRALGQILPEQTVVALARKVAGVESTRDRIIAGMIFAVERIAEQWDAHFILVPHYFDDYRMLADFVSHCRPRIAHQRMVSTGLCTLQGARHFYGRYAKADLAISMRVHSMSPAIGLHVPTVPLVTQDRLWDFLQEAGLEDIGIDAFAPDLGDRLHAAITAALQQPNMLRDRFAAVRRRLRAESRTFHQRMARLFGLSAAPAQ